MLTLILMGTLLGTIGLFLADIIAPGRKSPVVHAFADLWSAIDAGYEWIAGLFHGGIKH